MSLAVLSAGNNESQTCLQVPSRSNETVKADKRQRAAVQSLAGADVLQLLLQQVFERASLNGVVVESFYLQQQIQWEMEKYPSPRSPPKTMRNLHKLLSRMSLKQMVQLGLLEDVRRSSMQAGAIPAVISSFERSGQWEWVLHVLTACQDMGFHEDLPSLNAAISSLGQRWQRAAELFAGIQAKSLQPDIISLAAVTTSFGTSDRWECVLALGRLIQNRLESNVVSAGATITALQRGSQWESAVDALQRMPQTALQPNIVACNAGLGAAERGARAAWDQALSLQEKLRRFGHRLDVVSFNSAASVCSLERRWDVALAMLHIVPQAAIEAGLVGCNIAIHACEKVGRWREARPRHATLICKADLEQIMQKNRGKCTTTCDAKLGVERECRVGASGAARVQGHPRAVELHPRVMDSLDRSPPVINTRDAIAAFDAVLDQKLAALRLALMEEHRRLLHVSDFEVAKSEIGSRRSSMESGPIGSRRSSVESGPSGSRRSSTESGKVPPLASSQLETFPRAPPSLNDWFEDEPEEPPADIPENDGNRTSPKFSSSASSLSTSAVKDREGFYGSRSKVQKGW
eukprot:s5767_g3.t1